MNETITRYNALPKAHQKHVDFMYGGLDYWTLPDAFGPGEVLRFIISLENEIDDSLDTNVFGETVKSKAGGSRPHIKFHQPAIERLSDYQMAMINLENGCPEVEYLGVTCNNGNAVDEALAHYRIENITGKRNRVKGFKTW